MRFLVAAIAVAALGLPAAQGSPPARQAFLRAVVDLKTGSMLRTGFPARTRCPTLLVDDSRG